jgi:ribosomal protein S18 acetylase RimI-like enzyme
MHQTKTLKPSSAEGIQISLSPIDAASYPRFFERVAGLYAEESVNAGRWTREEALGKARDETEKILPEKERTTGNFLNWIMRGEEQIGYVWAGVSDNKPGEAFIYGIEVDEGQRGRGYGKEAMSLIEDLLRAKGFSSIALHVFEQSQAAVHIYEKKGYGTVSRLMRKTLEK